MSIYYNSITSNKFFIIDLVGLYQSIWLSIDSHLINQPSKIKRLCFVLLENQRLTHQLRSRVDSYKWIHLCWPTSTDTGCYQEDLLRAMADSVGWCESQENLYYKHFARGVIVIIVGNEHGDKSSNPGRGWWHFT